MHRHPRLPLAPQALEVRDFDASLVTELLGAFGAVKAVDVRDIEPGAKVGRAAHTAVLRLSESITRGHCAQRTRRL
jgi:hypothetical protein